MGYVYLAIAILAEVIGTTALKSTEGFRRLVPSLIVTAGYAIAFYCLSMSLKTIPVGIAYAIWAGIGIILITLLGWLVHHQALSWMAILGMAFITVGVVIVNLGAERLH